MYNVRTYNIISIICTVYTTYALAAILRDVLHSRVSSSVKIIINIRSLQAGSTVVGHPTYTRVNFLMCDINIIIINNNNLKRVTHGVQNL